MAKETLMQHNTADYNIAVQTIKDAILRSQYQAAKLVNREMLSLYYGIGRYISANSRDGFWGTGAIKAISERLRKEMPGLKGFSESSLKNMRMFYEEWSPVLESSDATSPISPIMIGEIETTTLLSAKSPITTDDLELFGNLSFTHHIRILNGEKDVNKRWKYIKLALENKWDTRYLQQQIKDNAADKYGTMPSNFDVTITNSRDAIKALSMFKDEYLLDFINTEEIGIRDLADIDERVVEKEIIHNIKKFIMTFGRDFAFVGNQYHLEAFSENFFPDLLFFNRELNCLVVVELKTGNFKPGYLAQLMTYLRILDDKVRKPHENPSIGIVLCKSANKDFVEYVIQDYAKPMGVATYRLSKDMPDKLREALPDIEELKKLL
ncbi:YhcG family protein [uncultured Phocaeicola sp.]|jgi:predicted nuclease of restriction endonuclease-like (RecB) superfamily|uniref:PDDEXK nuclease domain-containing protein n=1 Tax=uncultured Phocaeicola sp. TaxID=990718 RepID=UPI00263358D9|nr:PDDEXK nuclease domain-containing protein [uncultured Phocaeicola sp.]